MFVLDPFQFHIITTQQNGNSYFELIQILYELNYLLN